MPKAGGKWNTYEFTLNGPHLTVVLNGQKTVDVQDGQVTAVSATSITLKSSDGFTKTYVVTSSTTVDAQRDGIGSVKVGNQSSVYATVSGSTVTATNVADLTLLQQDHHGFGNWQGSGSGSAQPG